MADFWTDAKGALATVAPLLATAVGGPLAGTAVGLICNALGIDPATPPEQVAARVAAATPADLVAIKRAEGEFAAQMKSLDISAQALVYDNTKDARAMAIALRDDTPRQLAISITIGFFSLLIIMCFVTLPQANLAMLNITLGALSAGYGLMLAYYYGGVATQTAGQMLTSFRSALSK